MKACLIVLFSVFFLNCAALVLPVSDAETLTDENLLSGFVRVDPDDKKPETLQTKTWLWQDGDNLIVHFEAVIDSSFTRGDLSVRDEGASSDYLRLQLITIPDAYYAYYYSAYPLGNLLDGVRKTDMDVDYAWDSHYSYTSEITGDLWKVSMRIPLNELRFKQKKPYNWKVILTRYHYQSQEFFSLPYANTNQGKDYFLKASDIVLTQPVKHKLDISLKPYFVKSYDLISRSGSYDPEHVGLDIALNPGQRTRIKISLNPDYSDIPMDSAQDDYNRKDPPYYDENRFFFTEDIEAFGVSDEVFYSRSIVQPRLAFKATGNTKILNWGALGAFDKEIIDDGVLLNRDDYFQLLALNPSWRKLQLGNAITSRVNSGYYNHVYSGVLNWEYLPHLYFTTSLDLSTLKHASEGITDLFTGYKTAFKLSADPKDWNISLGYARLSKDLAMDAGYLYETDYEYAGTGIGWNKTYGETKIRYLSFNTWAYGYHKNLSTDPYYAYESGFTANLNTASRLNFLVNGSSARVPDLYDDLHDIYNGMLGCTWAKLRSLRIFGAYSYAQSLVYALSDTYPKHTFNINAWCSPLKNVSTTLTGSWNHYGYQEENVVGPVTIKLDKTYVIANATLGYTPSSQFKISLGSGLSTYESGNIRSSLSYYGNLRYEFKPEYFLFLGFKSAQKQDEPSSWPDPLGHFRKEMATIYAKISLTL